MSKVVKLEVSGSATNRATQSIFGCLFLKIWILTIEVIFFVLMNMLKLPRHAHLEIECPSNKSGKQVGMYIFT